MGNFAELFKAKQVEYQKLKDSQPVNIIKREREEKVELSSRLFEEVPVMDEKEEIKLLSDEEIEKAEMIERGFIEEDEEDEDIIEDSRIEFRRYFDDESIAEMVSSRMMSLLGV